jgi:uncharacterized protein YfbU (UPF0304 family)
MTLSDGEKLILVMLSGLYKKLDIKHEVDPDLVLSSIFDNQLWGLRWEYGSILQDSPDNDPPEVMETADILQMFTWIDRSFDSLSAPDKAKVEQGAGHNKHYLKFPGFDGNNDDHYHIASYMVDDLGRFDEYKGKDLNSHSIASLPKYKKMLPVYKTAIASHTNFLSPDQLIALLNA